MASGPAKPAGRIFAPPNPFPPPINRHAPAQPKMKPAGARNQSWPPPPAAQFHPSVVPRTGRAVQRATAKVNPDSSDTKAGATDIREWTEETDDDSPITGNPSNDQKDDDGQYVAMDKYGVGKGKLHTSALGNCIAVVAHDVPHCQAALTHYNTAALFVDEFKESATSLADDSLPGIIEKLKAVRDKLTSMLPGGSGINISYRVVLGMAWGPTSPYAGLMKKALFSVFGADWDKLIANVAFRVSFDPASGDLATKKS